MADYSLPDPVLSQIQAGFAGVPQLTTTIPVTDDYSLDPAIQSYLTGQPLMLDSGRKGGEPVPEPRNPEPAPQPAPAPQPVPVPIAGKTTLGPRGRNAIGEEGGFVGNEIASPTEVPSVTGGAIPTDVTQVAPVAAAPDLAPVTIPQMTPQQAQASNAALAKRQAAQAAYAASPEGQFAHSDQIKQQAVDEGQKSINDQLAAETAQNDATNKAVADMQAQQAAKDKAAADQLAQDQAYHRQLTQQYAQQVNDAANYKVDTDRHVGIGGLIAIALSGIGDALDHRHGPNAAAQIIDANIDKRINDQWQQKRALGDKANATKGLVDMAQGQVLDDRTQRQLDTATAHQQMADAIDAAARQSANPLARARAEQLSADQRLKSAAIIDAAAQRGVQARKDAQDVAFRRAQLGLEAQGQARADKQFEFEKQKWADTLKMQKDALEAAGKQAQAKALQDQADKTQQEGVFDPRTGDGLLDPQGRAKMQQADALEAQARTIADPAMQQQARQQAQALRADAHFNNVYTIKDTTARKEVTDNIGANQELVDIIGRTKQALAGDPSSFDRDQWAALKTDFESAKAEWIAAHGGKPSSREFEAIGDMFGSDPASFIDRAASRGKMEASLDELQRFAVGDATNVLHRHGVKDEWHPRTAATSDTTLGGETAAEAGEGATPGVIAPMNPFGSQGLPAQLGHGLYNVITGSKPTTPQEAAEQAAPFTQSGLAPQDEQTVRGIIAQTGKASDARYGDLVNQLSVLAQNPRVAPGVLSVLRGNPALYRDVVKTLPVGQQAALQSFDSALKGVDLPTIPGDK